MRYRFASLVAGAMMVGALIVSSCSSSPVSQPTSTTSSKETKPYGSLTIANNFGKHIDPLLDSAVGFATIGSAVFDTLWYFDVDNYEATPGIAERWEISPDGLTHTFYIRKGVKWHDGTDLTGADVKISLERMIGPKSTSPVGATLWRASIASVELKDDYT
ncbi:MAG: ABC transporter substrate-binding protein, partial [Dehalococcoidia bacterium]|nr:ABC transporter substrate-binding protein [Dehalococcoidia bacterium]